MMNATGGLAVFGPQTPNDFLEVNPEIVRLSPHQGEEHLEAHCVSQPFTFESERRDSCHSIKDRA